jgi:hypothetical protein
MYVYVFILRNILTIHWNKNFKLFWVLFNTFLILFNTVHYCFSSALVTWLLFLKINPIIFWIRNYDNSKTVFVKVMLGIQEYLLSTHYFIVHHTHNVFRLRSHPSIFCTTYTLQFPEPHTTPASRLSIIQLKCYKFNVAMETARLTAVAFKGRTS